MTHDPLTIACSAADFLIRRLLSNWRVWWGNGCVWRLVIGGRGTCRLDVSGVVMSPPGDRLRATSSEHVVCRPGRSITTTISAPSHRPTAVPTVVGVRARVINNHRSHVDQSPRDSAPTMAAVVHVEPARKLSGSLYLSLKPMSKTLVYKTKSPV